MQELQESMSNNTKLFCNHGRPPPAPRTIEVQVHYGHGTRPAFGGGGEEEKRSAERWTRRRGGRRPWRRTPRSATAAQEWMLVHRPARTPGALGPQLAAT